MQVSPETKFEFRERLTVPRCEDIRCRQILQLPLIIKIHDNGDAYSLYRQQSSHSPEELKGN